MQADGQWYTLLAMTTDARTVTILVDLTELLQRAGDEQERT